MTNAFSAPLEMGWVVKATPRPIHPRGREPVPIFQEARWASGTVWRNRENSQKEPTRCNRVVEFIIPVFLNCLTCFGRHTAHHQELKNCNCSLWFYIRFWLPAAEMAQPSQRPLNKTVLTLSEWIWSVETRDVSISKTHVHFSLVRSSQIVWLYPKKCVTSSRILIFFK
jgi:hypothetical protein